MSNNKKWKNRKINLQSYVVSEEKPKKTLSKSWRIALTGLFLIAIPSFLMFLLIGKDGWIISNTKSFDRWAFELPIALAISAIQLMGIFLLIWRFKVFGVEALTFLVPITLAMNSFLVSSGAKEWFLRVLPAVAIAFLAIPILIINKKIAKKIENKKLDQMLAEEKKNKSLLD
ncbi:hypothetical protein [Metamycoplasma equirhinis]|uniref:hypothetical protein n=1 Tax=Metamycoplasma equirhinis TaxID=92402 RepID=UPI00359383DB